MESKMASKIYDVTRSKGDKHPASDESDQEAASDESELPVGKPPRGWHDRTTKATLHRERTSSGKTAERERELYSDTDSVDQLHLADATATQMVRFRLNSEGHAQLNYNVMRQSSFW